MKKLIFILMATLAVACSSDPEYHGLTQKEKETFAQSIAGEYRGRYEIIYSDAQAQQTTGEEKLRRQTVNDITFSVSDLTRSTVVFNAFPISVLAHVVDDPELSQALSTLPDMGVTGNYEFNKGGEEGQVNWVSTLNPISLSLTYGGKQHDIVVQFWNPYTFVEFSKDQLKDGATFMQNAVLQLQVTAIYDGDRLLHDLSGWGKDERTLIAQFYFGQR